MKSNRHMISFSLLLWATLLVSVVDSDLASARAAMVALRANVRGRLLYWNISSNPCNWTGVNCSSNRVVELRLPGMGLLALRNLYLQGSRFSGEIPAVLFTLKNLIRHNLANNNFSGPIPDSVRNLTRLGTLYLENNNLSGSIPDINLPSLVKFNVSFNQLNGSIPRGLSSNPQSAFLGNSLCGSPLVSCNGTESSGDNLSGGAIAGIVIGCLLGLLLILILLLCLCRRKSGEKIDETRGRDVAPAQQPVVEIPGDNAAGESDSRSSGLSGIAKEEAKSSGVKNLVFFGKPLRVFDLEDLLRASAEVLGKGTFGTKNKATLDMGMVVAVKRLKDVTVSEKEFKEKMDVVGAMEHQNLVRVIIAVLRCACRKLNLSMNVFSNPAHFIDHNISGNREAGRTPLNWDTRSGIALELPEALHTSIPRAPKSPMETSNRQISYLRHRTKLEYLILVLLNLLALYRLPYVLTAIVLRKRRMLVKSPKRLMSKASTVEEDMIQLLQLAINCTVQYPANRPSMAEVTNQIDELCRSNPKKETH
ncbi:Detected protein of unknown function [Hibiscus syriacus]|uniref:Leucine-rich repeat-containing N-terminal plant-type domain-containing protein n=1 Tax=Hibiscus syriacus TaxID=106335 RepID=A0A6A2ZUV7_HIBSY|nr:Detected protein of unknown function [Hibiscus syriacus]